MMMQKSEMEGIPAFLLVKNRDKIKTKRGAKVVVAAEEQPTIDPLTVIEDEKFREYVRAEMRAGRFHLHWMEDPITMALMRRSIEVKAEAREARIEAKKAEKAAIKAVKPEFGLFIRIVIVIADPKRKDGSARTPIWNAMKAFIAANPNASVAEVFKSTQYKKTDFDRDLKLKNIKTDIVKSSAPPEPVKVEVKAKKKAAKKGKAK